MSAVMSEPRAGRMNALQRVLAAALGLTLLAAALLPVFEQAGALPAVSRLEIVGEFQHLDPAQLRVQLQPQLDGNLLTLDLDALQAAAQSQPWVASARIERIWPDAVRISLSERVPMAHWGTQSLLAHDGVLFTPASQLRLDGLPQLSGPQGQHAQVQRTFQELSVRIGGGDFALKALDLSGRGEWTAQTVHGIELRLGRGDPLPKAGVIAGSVTRALARRLAEIAYVDLRYSNGFAVGWRESAGKGEKP